MWPLKCLLPNSQDISARLFYSAFKWSSFRLGGIPLVMSLKDYKTLLNCLVYKVLDAHGLVFNLQNLILEKCCHLLVVHRSAANKNPRVIPTCDLCTFSHCQKWVFVTKHILRCNLNCIHCISVRQIIKYSVRACQQNQEDDLCGEVCGHFFLSLLWFTFKLIREPDFTLVPNRTV